MIAYWYKTYIPRFGEGAKKNENKKGKVVPPALGTVRSTSIYNPQIEDKSHVTAARLTNLFMLARTSLLSELILASIKKVVAPLEVGQSFGFN
jgi:hypothetical protein